MEKEILHHIELTTDKIRQLEEQVKETISTGYRMQDAETRNAVNNLLIATDNLRWLMVAMVLGGSSGVQTTCPRCNGTITISVS